MGIREGLGMEKTESTGKNTLCLGRQNIFIKNTLSCKWVHQYYLPRFHLYIPLIQNRLVDTVGDGESRMNKERSTDTYTFPYVKQIASGNLLYDAGS